MNTQANAMTTVPAVLLKKQVTKWIARGARTTMKIVIVPMRAIEGVLNGEGMVRLVGPGERPQQRHEFENVHVREARNFQAWL